MHMLNKLLRVTRPLQLRRGVLLPILLLLSFTLMLPEYSAGADQPHGLPPADDATYIPQLGGLLNQTRRNHYGQEKDLAECLVLRGSKIKDSKISVPAGGLFYASSTSMDAKPLRGDPFIILGRTAYLLSLKTGQVIRKDVVLNKKDKVLLDDEGYRLWFDYATDHYGKPYGEFAVMAPSGGWQSELPIGSSFPEPEEARNFKMKEGINPQQIPFVMTSSYKYGATVVTAKKITHKDAVFSEVKYPVIHEAVFSLDRPYVIGVRQESYRLWRNRRIYAFRKENGILVEIRNWTGRKVLASKLLIPATQQEYHVTHQEKMSLTDFDLDMHIELVVNPSWFKGSDFGPWANDVPYGWTHGTISFMIFNDLVKLKNGEPWPRDDRYIVRLEAEAMSGMLKRVVLENKEPFELTNDKNSYDGPICMSDFWDRRYFSVVAKKIEGDLVKINYVRDSWFRRTDNLILWKEGRGNADFFIGMSELVVSVMEDTFLTRLADPSYGVPVVKSKFTSYPPAITLAKGFAPDPDCAFVPKMKGLTRRFIVNRKGEKVVCSDAIVIRGSYVDYRQGKIIIPPAGLYYSTRLGRNVRPLAGETIYILGKKAYLLSTESYIVVKRNVAIDFWKLLPMGDENLLFWQDVPLGDGNKVIRFLGSRLIWGRPVVQARIIKYSGNAFGADMLVGPGLSDYTPLYGDKSFMDQTYTLRDIYAEGATYVILRWVSPDGLEVAEMGSPGMDSFTISYEAPQKLVLKAGEEAAVGNYKLRVVNVDQGQKTVKLALLDGKGTVAAEKKLGPVDQKVYDLLPQYSPAQQKVMMQYKDIHVELDLPADFREGKVTLYATTGAHKLERDKPWASDPRFTMRPDVCGHCYMLNEFIIDNPKPIILDAKNPTYTGPDGYFKIVIDDFDGEKIQAWHMEDKTGWKTPNLAELARNNIDVMVGVNGTTEHFLRKTLLKRLAYREIWRLK
jgi:hypothetical protein